MNGQFLMNKAITVQYAFKKDGKGERHGTSAERLLAAQARKNNALPVSARPPPAPAAVFGATRPPMQFQGPYQGQFAGVLAAPPPPPGFGPPQGMMPPTMGMPPAMGMQPPMGMYGAPPPGFMPPPPPGFGGPGVPTMPVNQMMPPPPPPVMQ